VDKITFINPTVEIFSQGEEVVTGQVADTNAAWLSSQLIAMGFKVSRHTAVGDQLDALINLLKEIASRSDCCLCTGGLGPTTDDLTREAVAVAFDAPLYFDETALKNIQGFFQQRGKVMAEVNRQQAFFPQGATPIDNLWGTAPAFSFKFERCLFIFLPGVPYEMQQLFNVKIKQSLAACFALKPQSLITIKTFGIGESELQGVLNTLNLPDFVTIGFRATADEVQVKLLFNASVTIDDKKILIHQITHKMGDNVFAIDGLEKRVGNLVDIVSTRLEENKQTLAMIETVSQGLFAAKCVGHVWLLNSSFCANLETLKQQWQLETEAELSVIAKRLAKKLQQQSGADFALVQLYDEGNALGNNNHPHLLYNTLQTPQGIYQQIQTLNGSQKNQQNRAAMLGFDLLRRYLQQKKL
jgi:competence/damage-inducible protein CinA-like protein